ncbi:hypothetical protein [Nocardia sp. XZ_19_385]|uniref:hypothetical protein n=1 Tax=Nocardia sp. XZ_19_385 TaxID=2769488 RepID=UPI001890B09F|nr:hypothetical protein [Nocardia sp. XZ_19_385]
MKRLDPSSSLTYDDAVRIARDQARDPGSVVYYSHQSLENASYGRGFAFLETIRSDRGDLDAYVLVSTVGCASGLLSEAGRTIDTVIAEHLAQAAHANRDISDSELGVAQRLALEAYDAGLTRIDEVAGGIDPETVDYAEFVLLILRSSGGPTVSGRKILARSDFLLQSPTPGRRYTQPCPLCERPAVYEGRYPRMVCYHCRDRTTDRAGRRVVGFNTDAFGGMIAYYADALEHPDGSGPHQEESVEVTRTGVCFIDGHPATMREGRFGGIVVELASAD